MNLSIMRYIFAFFCILLIIAHAFFPELKVDQTSVWLLVIAIASLFLPHILEILKQAKRFKTGPFELELGENLQNLVKSTENAEKAVENMPPPEPQGVVIPENLKERIGCSASDPRDLLLAISIEIQQKLINIAQFHGIQPKHTVIQIAQQLNDEGIASPDEVYFTLLKFWETRDMIVHGNSYRLSSKYLYEIIELGLRLYNLLDYWKRKPQK